MSDVNLALEMELLQKNFLCNVSDRINEMEELVLKMETWDDSQNEILQEILSHAHSLKGAAASHQLTFISTCCHKFEDLITTLQATQNAPPAKEAIDKLLAHLDILSKYAKNLLNDGAVDEMQERSRKYAKDILKSTIPVTFAKQGMEISSSSQKIIVPASQMEVSA